MQRSVAGAWPQIVTQRLETITLNRRQRQVIRSLERPRLPVEVAPADSSRSGPLQSVPESETAKPDKASPKAYRPSQDHPWRGMAFGSARYRDPRGFTRAKG